MNGNNNQAEVILIFATDQLLKIRFSSTTTTYADGTFYIAPIRFKQAFTMHAMYSRRSFPCIYAIMTHKSQESYGALLAFMTNKATQLFHLKHPIKWVNTLTDFESGLLPALNAHVFGNQAVHVRGCHFHHTMRNQM